MRSPVLAFAALLVIGASPRIAPDTVYYNGKVVTVDRGFSIKPAFAVRGDRFIAVGSNDQVRALAGRETRLVDLRGATVIPGLADAHDHLFALERLVRGVDLAGATSTDEVLRRLRLRVAAAKPGETVFGSTGWRAPLTRAALDSVSTDIPIVVFRMRRGAAVMNRAALARLGVSKASSRFMTTSFPVDAAGEPTGEMPDWPFGLIAANKLVPPATPAEEEGWILRGQKQRNALGITSIRDLSNWPDWLRAYFRIWAKHQLTLRVSLGASLPDPADPLQLARDQWVGPSIRDDWIDFDTLGEEPSPDFLGPAAFASFAQSVDALGWRLAPHVENAGMESAISAFEAVDRVHPLAGRHWVLEHMNGITPAQMDRLARMGVVVSIQSNVEHRWDYFAKTEGKASAERQTPAQEMIDHHLILISGSDILTQTPENDRVNDPFFRMHFFVTRRASDGHIMGPEQRVSRADALRFATINYAYATGTEISRGSIEPGKLADFVVLSGDYLTVSDDDILKLHAVATYVGARQVFGASLP